MFTEKNIYTVLIIIGAVVLVSWFWYEPAGDISKRIPGQDNRPDSILSGNEKVIIGQNFAKLSNISSELTGKWTRFRGADFDNINKENIKLIDKFGNEAAKILWTIDLGNGHASPAIYNGKVYLLDYIENKKSDALRCFSLETGKELWQRSYKVNIKRNHGISRTAPAVSDSFIVTIGPKCHVMCSNRETGALLWGIDLVKDYNTEIPFWYTGQCPLIDNDTAVIAPGGSSLLIGVECSTGKVVWQTPNPDKQKMSHSSVMLMNFGGKKMYVYAAIGGIYGISADKNDKGKILWKTDEFSPSVVAPSPVILDNGKIFITAGYGAGSMLFQLIKDGENFKVKVLQKYKPKDGLACEQQTPIYYKGHIFSIQPKDAGAMRNQMICCKADDCKKIIWKSGKTNRFGLGPYIIADNKFFILNDDGTLTIAKVSTSKFIFSDKIKLMEGHDAWAPIAIADGKLIMRDADKMLCLDIKYKK